MPAVPTSSLAEGGRPVDALDSGVSDGQARVYHNRAGASYPLRLLANNCEGPWKFRMNDNPWIKLYPGDWRNNQDLQACSLAARGLWVELLNLMRGCKREGWLEVAGKAMTVERIAVAVGAPLADVAAALAELEAAGVAKRIDGVLVSRRMIRYAHRSKDGAKSVEKRWNRPQDAQNGAPNRVPLIGKSHRSDGSESESSDSDSGVGSGSVLNALNPETQSKGKLRGDKSRRINPETYPLPPELESPEFRVALVDYLRTRKGGVWHESLAETSVKRMVAWGRARSIAALESSQGAQGLFEPRIGPGSLFDRDRASRAAAGSGAGNGNGAVSRNGRTRPGEYPETSAAMPRII